MPQSVENLVEKLLSDSSFYPDLPADERKSRAYAIANDRLRASIADPILFTASEDEFSCHMLLGSQGEPQLLLFKNAVLARAEVNFNNDEIDETGIEELAATIARWPIDIEHNRHEIAGMFTEGRKKDRALLVDGAIWADRYPAEAREVMEGKRRLSIEAKADTATCSVCGKIYASAGDYCEHLDDKRKHGAVRKLAGLKARGGALTRYPAGTDTHFDPNQIYVVANHAERRPTGLTVDASWYDSYLPAGETLADLPNSDFADPEGRRFPYKIHGKVIERGWRAAWSAANGGHTGNADSGAVARLRRDKPAGVHIEESTMTDEEIQKLQNDLAAAQAKIGALEIEAQKVPGLEANVAALTGERDGLKTANTDLQAKVDAAAKKEAELLASTRRAKLAGVLTDEEWSAQKDELTRLSDPAFELVASKLAKPAPARRTPLRVPDAANGDRKVVLVD